MRRCIRRLRSTPAGYGCLLAAVLCVSRADGGALPEFRLTDYLGHHWNNELVSFPITTEDVKPGRHYAVQRPDGKLAGCQLADTEGGRVCWFLATLPSMSTVRYRLVETGTIAPSGIQIEEGERSVRIWNSEIGIELRRELTGDEGPVAAVRLRSGEWVGDSRLQVNRKVVSSTLEVTARGPVYAEVLLRMECESGGEWALRLKLIDREPVVIMDETFSLGDESQWILELGRGLGPSHAIFRTAWYRPEEWPSHSLKAESLFTAGRSAPFRLLPWINWSDGREVSSLSVYREGEGVRFSHDAARRRLVRDDSDKAAPDDRDVLFVAAGLARDWALPAGDRGPDLAVPLETSDDGGAELRLQLRGPSRHWILGTSVVGRTLVSDSDLTDSERYGIKYCGTALNDVQRMILVWGGHDARQRYPRITGESRSRVSGASGAVAAGRKQAEAVLQTSLNWGRLFTENIGTFDEQKGQHVRRHDARVWTHLFCRVKMIIDADDALGAGFLTNEEFVRLRARLAFTAYSTASPDYYSHDLGWSANPNMTTMRHAVVGLLGCLLSDHPESRRWYELGAREFRRQLDEWVDSHGGWLESPHYQSILGDGILLLHAAHRVGLSDDLYHPNLLKTVLYLAKISTPPDPRFQGRRHLPEVGNTYRCETTGLTGILASIHRERTPDVAAELQWMWQQQGQPMWTGIGGGSFIASKMEEFVDRSWHVRSAPQWGSEVFPKSGTILRSHFPSDRETTVYVLHGEFNQHYDTDRGSFSLWGKGQPLCLDWGYAQPYSAEMHNMLTTGSRVGNVADFRVGKAADFLQVDLGSWQRQVLLARDESSAGANFVVVRDTSERAGHWRQWFYTKSPLSRAGAVVRMRGRGDVDLDVWFASGRASEFSRISSETAAALLVSAPPDTDGETAAYAASSGTAVDGETDYLQSTDAVLNGSEGTLNGSVVTRPLLQRGLQLKVDPDQCVMALYYPRIRGEQSPVFRELAGGNGVCVQSVHGTDYVFLATSPLVYQDQEVSFRGTVGAIRRRKGTVTLTLGASGEIHCDGHGFTSETAATREF